MPCTPETSVLDALHAYLRQKQSITMGTFSSWCCSVHVRSTMHVSGRELFGLRSNENLCPAEMCMSKKLTPLALPKPRTSSSSWVVTLPQGRGTPPLLSTSSEGKYLLTHESLITREYVYCRGGRRCWIKAVPRSRE